MEKRIVGIAAVVLATAALVGCSTEPQAKGPKTATVQSSEVVLKKQAPSIVGTYSDDSDGAAILFRKNGTGRYVYRDSKNGNTDDQFTWKKKNSTTFEVTMNDDDVVNPLTAKISQNSLTLSGSDNWNTESFNRVMGKQLDLDDFLKEGDSSSSSASRSQSFSSEAQSSSNSSSSTQKSNVAGDEGLFDIPSDMQGTWYSADNFWSDKDDDTIHTVTIGAHTVSYEDSDGSGTTTLHKMSKDFDFTDTKYLQNKAYQKTTKDWGRSYIANLDGHRVLNVRGWLQDAGDGEYYYIAQEEGQTVLVTAHGAGVWADAVYWKDQATAKKYANKVFSNIRYYDGIQSNDDLDDE
ncbi:lipocalin/fatty acid-binding family protein [Lactobacillus sp.]|uniref:lipocalin/fatty acid-binding family protein n=1 Tax=Lactobacillus sp. TaxID=1591 RepID=UPI0019BF1D2D|nr:lipocalin/fatty acid-binding family protein [Lactobacillus sp.]MBD5429133.1 hypothetical protein [Lactobacillus sp.]